MPHIHVSSLPGRSVEEKKKIADALMKALMASGNNITQDMCYVTIGEVERKNWLEYDRLNISQNQDNLYIYKGDAKK